MDSSAALDIATGRSVYGQALVDTALRSGDVLSIPAVALMEAWAGIGSEMEDQAPLVLLRSLPVVVVEHLDGESAERAGALAAERGQPATGMAQAVYVARRRDWSVVTADIDGVLALDPYVPFESLP